MEHNTITIPLEDYEQLKKERDQYKADINLTASNISKLLKDLGIISPDGELQFSFGSLTRTLQGVLFNPKKAETKFSYLSELAPIIKNYATLNEE